MRRLLNSLRDWLYLHTPATKATLLEHSVPVGRVQDVESRLAALEAVVDRFVSPRIAAKELLNLLAQLPEEEALAAVKQTIERMKAEGEL